MINATKTTGLNLCLPKREDCRLGFAELASSEQPTGMLHTFVPSLVAAAKVIPRFWQLALLFSCKSKGSGCWARMPRVFEALA